MIQKTSVDLPWAAGLDLKTSPLLVLPPHLVLAQNGIFQEGGVIKKRNGFLTLPPLPAGQAGAKLSQLNNELLAISQNGTLSSYAVGSKTWVGKGSLSPCEWIQRPIIANSYQQQNPSADSLLGITVAAWEENVSGTIGVFYSVFDEITGQVLLSHVSLDTTGTNPHVVAGGGYLSIVWANAGTIFVQAVNPLTPTAALTTKNTLATNAAASALTMDVVRNLGDSTSLIFAYQSTTAAQVEVGYVYANASVSAVPTVGTPLNGYTNPQLTTIKGSLTVGLVQAAIPGSQIAFLLAGDATNGLYSASLSPALAASNPRQVDVSTAVGNVGGVVASGLATQCTITYEIQVGAPTAATDYVKTATISSTLAPSGISVLVRSVGMACAPFLGGDGNVYVLVTYEDTLQSGLFLYSVALAPTTPEDGPLPGTLLGNGFPGTSGGLYTSGAVPRVFSPAPDLFSLPITSRLQSEAEVANATAGTVTTYQFNFITGIDRLDLDWTSPAYRSVQHGQNTLFSGGQISAYDGVSVMENGFPLYPNIPAASITQSTGGNIADGTYSVVGVWSWRDQERQFWRSAPSPAQNVTIAGGGGNASIAVVFPTLRVTNKSSHAPIPRADIILQVFRTTAADPSVWQLCGLNGGDPVTAPVYNDVTADSVTVKLEEADATIAGNEILYTVGGQLPNLPQPPASIIWSSKTRTFFAGVPGQPFTVYYSQEVTPGEPGEFNQFLSQAVPQLDGPVTAGATSDVNVLVFKENSVYSFAGDGPDSTGQNNQFTGVNLVTGDVGCVQPESICTGPSGTFFKSNKGIYLIDRSLQVSYVGAPVEAFNSLNITSATLITGTNQVRFTTDGGIVLVYDYFFGQWSTFQPIAAVSAINWATGGVFSPAAGINPSFLYVWLDAAGVVHYETPGQYLDGTAAITKLEKSAPLHLAGLNGYQRIIRLYFLAEWFSPHKLQVDLFYNNNPNPSSTIIVDPAEWMAGTPFGSGPFGAGPFGGSIPGPSPTVYNFMIPVSQQQCQTLQVQISDVDQGNGASYTVDVMTILYGKQSEKLPVGRLKTIGNR